MSAAFPSKVDRGISGALTISAYSIPVLFIASMLMLVIGGVGENDMVQALGYLTLVTIIPVMIAVAILDHLEVSRLYR